MSLSTHLARATVRSLLTEAQRNQKNSYISHIWRADNIWMCTLCKERQRRDEGERLGGARLPGQSEGWRSIDVVQK